MRIGVPLETKPGETRVGLTPEAVRSLVDGGHELLIQRGAGDRVGYPDEAYRTAGAGIVAGPRRAFAADLVVKVKEIQPAEYALLRPDTIIMAFQQLGPARDLLDAVLKSGVTCIGYETVENARGDLPILAPMSRIAGCLAPQIASWILQQGGPTGRDPSLWGPGILMSSICGLPAARVVIIGSGNVGMEAARIASGLGSEVLVFARTARRFEALQKICPHPVETRSLADRDPDEFADSVRHADVVIGALLSPGRLSPKLISRALLGQMRAGAVLVDVGIDQGGIAESSRPTTHASPLFVESGVLHYCVPNIPALVARSATLALTRTSLPYVQAIADFGLDRAARLDPGLGRGVQVHNHAVADARLALDTGRPLWEPAWPRT